MNAAGHSSTAPNESDFTIKDHLYLKMASHWEYKYVGKRFRRQLCDKYKSCERTKSNNLHNLKKINKNTLKSYKS